MEWRRRRLHLPVNVTVTWREEPADLLQSLQRAVRKMERRMRRMKTGPGDRKHDATTSAPTAAMITGREREVSHMNNPHRIMGKYLQFRINLVGTSKVVSPF